jgi:hypothetical protein
MKRDAGLGDIFDKTEPDAVPAEELVDVPAQGRTVPTSVGLKESEVALLDDIAGKHRLARNAVMRWGLRFFLRAYLVGEVNLDDSIDTPEPRRRLKML